MKILSLIFCLSVPFTATSQQIACHIELARGPHGATGVLIPIRFQIQLKDTVFLSNREGVMELSDSFMRNHLNDTILSFTFPDKEDYKFFKEPSFTREQHLLKEYCNLHLICEFDPPSGVGKRGS
jgi:hypothetical protein